MDKRLPKKTIRRLILGAIVTIALLLLGVALSLSFNDGRWVYNMDLSTYSFQLKDLFMLVPGALLFCYAIYFLVAIWSHAVKLMFTKEPSEDGRSYSRTISPHFGWLGFFGFLGFGGFWTYAAFDKIFPFIRVFRFLRIFLRRQTLPHPRG